MEPTRDYCPRGKIHSFTLSMAEHEVCGFLHPTCLCGFVDYSRAECATHAFKPALMDHPTHEICVHCGFSREIE